MRGNRDRRRASLRAKLAATRGSSVRILFPAPIIGEPEAQSLPVCLGAMMATCRIASAIHEVSLHPATEQR